MGNLSERIGLGVRCAENDNEENYDDHDEDENDEFTSSSPPLKPPLDAVPLRRNARGSLNHHRFQYYGHT